ncbi:MAG: hypothetical protein ABI905_15540 [Betaproteobacteria bacterium]
MRKKFARSMALRPRLISSIAVCGAVIWGAAEVFALQWSRLAAKLRAGDKSQAF